MRVNLIAIFFVLFPFLPAFAFTDSISHSVSYLEQHGVFSESEQEKAFNGKKAANRQMIIEWSKNLLLQKDVENAIDIFQSIGAFELWGQNKNFMSKKKITRTEALSFLFRVENISLLSASLSPVPENIIDFPKNPKAKAILLTALQLNIISPDDKNKIYPNKKITKEELASFMEKIHTLNNKKESFVLQSDYETIKNLLEKNYLFSKDFNIDAANDAAFDAMMKTLNDPYSVYMPPEASENFTNYINDVPIEIEGYAGIGVSIQEANNGGVVITELFASSPAAIAGMQTGDVIVSVNGNDITQLPIDAIVSQIKGPENTVVHLQVKRGNKTISFEVVRKKIIIEGLANITATTRDDIVWIKIRGFKTFSSDEWKDVLAKNITQNTKGIIIDLRYNPGGLLEAAQEMLGEILPAKFIATRLQEHGQETIYEVIGSGKYTDIPLVVFQNEYSASASEIFSASIQDYQRGKIIGTTSFGKGFAQNLFFLQRGSIKLTTAEFFSPLGKTIHKKGIIPDVVLSEYDDESYFQAAKKALQK